MVKVEIYMKISEMTVNYIYEPAEKTVLFLHGWNAPFEIYAPVLDFLRSLGFGIAAFDMPGVGKTSEPQKPLTLDDYVSFTLDFCKQIGLKNAVIFCHSNGGRIAARLLSMKNCPIFCEKAVFFASAGVKMPKTAGQKISLALYKLLKILGTKKPFSYLFDELYERVRDKRSSADYKAASPVMKKTMSNLLESDISACLPDISAEVLLIFGENDTATPLFLAEKMHALIKNSGLVAVKNAGHFAYLGNPGQFYGALSAFLGGAL